MRRPIPPLVFLAAVVDRATHIAETTFPNLHSTSSPQVGLVVTVTVAPAVVPSIFLMVNIYNGIDPYLNQFHSMTKFRSPKYTDTGSLHILVCLFKHRALLWSGKREDRLLVRDESVVRFPVRPTLRCDFRVSRRTRPVKTLQQRWISFWRYTSALKQWVCQMRWYFWTMYSTVANNYTLRGYSSKYLRFL